MKRGYADMPKPFKLAILRARHDPAYQYIPDQTCIEMVMTGTQSVLRYWSDTTHGYFDFLNSALLPWVEVTLTPPNTDRGTQVTTAIQAVRAANPGFDPLAGFDGVLLFTLPGGQIISGSFSGWDGGSGTLGDGRPYSTIPVIPSTGVFTCHELGHTLGFEHTFGIDNNGTDWAPGDATIIVGPEYGAPHDIMSAESFGTRYLGTGPKWSGNPTYRGDYIPNWPADSFRWRGPHISRANLHHFYPDAFVGGRVVEHPFPVAGQSGRVRLGPPSGRGGATLLILHPPGEPGTGVGRVYVEYRPARDWDVGLKYDLSNLSQAGLVVHTLETVAPGVERVWYRGGVPMNGIDFDFQLSGSALTITLEAFENDDNGCWADISWALGSTRSATIQIGDPIITPLGQSGSKEGRTPCGDVTTKVTWSTSTLTFFSVRTLGFGGSPLPGTQPTIAWHVDGTPVSAPSGTVDILFNGSTFALEYTIDPLTFELGVTSRGGERLEASVDVIASEAGGRPSSSGSARFEAEGWHEEYTPESVAVIARCIDRLNRYVVVEDGPITPHGPGPVERPDPIHIRQFAEEIRSGGLVLHPRTQIQVDQLSRFGL